MTVDPIVIGMGIAIAVVALIVVLMLLFTGRRAPAKEEPHGLATSFQNLTQTIQLGQAQISILTEKVNRLEPLIKSSGSIEAGFGELAERVSKIERNQAVANQGLGAIAAGLAQSESNLVSQVGKSQQESLESLHVVSNDLSEELTRIKTDLATLHASVSARQELEQHTGESIRRLEMLVTGAHANASAGENVLDAMFAKLPIDWQVRNFRVNGTQVEFGLRLPNGLILPIDSTWAAGELLEQFSAAQNGDEQRRLKGEIESVVLQKASAVTKSINAGVTVAFGIAIVPDAVYDLCSAVRAEAFQMNVVVLSYSLFVPYLLLVFQTILKAGQNIDLQKWDTHVRALLDNISRLQEELDSGFSEALTLLNRARDEMRAQLGKAGASLTALQIHTGVTTAEPVLIENGRRDLHEEPQRGLW